MSEAGAAAEVPQEYTLKVPVEYGAQVVETVTIKPITPRMMRPLPAVVTQWTMGTTMDLIGSMIGQPGPFIDKLDAQDYMVLNEYMNRFLAPYLLAGGAA